MSDATFFLETHTAVAYVDGEPVPVVIGGAQGPAGGPQGIQGPQGEPGADSTVPGPPGPKGDKGDTGAASTVPGPTGPKGDKGDKGDTGATGAASTVPGPPGPTGDSGVVSDGDKGDVVVSAGGNHWKVESAEGDFDVAGFVEFGPNADRIKGLGIANTASLGIGSGTLAAQTTGGRNLAIGYQAGASMTIGNLGAFIGYQAGQFVTGSSNTAIGSTAMVGAVGATTGAANLAIGSSALLALTAGNANMALGAGAGQNITTGSYNVLVGYQAGGGIATGGGNIILGNVTGLAAGLTNNLILKTGAGNVISDDGAVTAFIHPVAVTGKVSATQGVNGNSASASSTPNRNPGVYAFNNAAAADTYGVNTYGMELGNDGVHYLTRIFASVNQAVAIGSSSADALQAGFVDWAKFTLAGLAVTGVVNTTGAITANGAVIGALLKTSSGEILRGDGARMIYAVPGDSLYFYSNGSGVYRWTNSPNTVQTMVLDNVGNLNVTGTVSVNGSPLATVSQLANYLPLTGGQLTGTLALKFDNPMLEWRNAAGTIQGIDFFASGTRYFRSDGGFIFANNAAAQVANIGSSGIYVPGFTNSFGGVGGTVANGEFIIRNSNTPGGFTNFKFDSAPTGGSPVMTDAYFTAVSNGQFNIGTRLQTTFLIAGAAIATVFPTGLDVAAGKALTVDGKRALVMAAAGNNGAVTISAAAPSGGADGDIWLQYV